RRMTAGLVSVGAHVVLLLAITILPGPAAPPPPTVELTPILVVAPPLPPKPPPPAPPQMQPVVAPRPRRSIRRPGRALRRADQRGAGQRGRDDRARDRRRADRQRHRGHPAAVDADPRSP